MNESTNAIRNYTLYLNMAQADQVSVANTDCTFILNNPIKLISANNRFKVRLISMTCPFTFKQVNNTNNTIQVVTASGTINVTIPSGNYNIIDLATAFCNEIRAAILLIFGVVVTIVPVYNPSTSFVTFSLTVAPLGYFIAVNYNAQNQVILNMIGFNNFNFVVTTATPNITSNAAVNVNPSMEIQVRSRNLTQDSSAEALTAPCSTSNIIGNVQINTGQFGYISFYNSLNYWNSIGNRVIDNVNLYLTTVMGDMIQQSLPSSFCLEIIEVGNHTQELGLKNSGLFTQNEKNEIIKMETQRNELIASLDARLQQKKDKLKLKLLTSKADAFQVNSEDEA